MENIQFKGHWLPVLIGFKVTCCVVLTYAAVILFLEEEEMAKQYPYSDQEKTEGSKPEMDEDEKNILQVIDN